MVIDVRILILSEFFLRLGNSSVIIKFFGYFLYRVKISCNVINYRLGLTFVYQVKLTFTIRDSAPRRLCVQKYLSNRVKRSLKYPIWRSLILAVIVHTVVIMFPIPIARNRNDNIATCHSASSLEIIFS